MIMTVLSSILVTYTTIFKSKETDFFISMPVPFENIFKIRFIEVIIFSCWAPLALTVPFLMSYGFFQHMSWIYYVMSFVVLIPFFIFLCVVGSIFATLLLRLFEPKRIGQIAAVIGLIALIAAVVYVQQLRGAQINSAEVYLQRLIPRFTLAFSFLSASFSLGLVSALGSGLEVGVTVSFLPSLVAFTPPLKLPVYGPSLYTLIVGTCNASAARGD